MLRSIWRIAVKICTLALVAEGAILSGRQPNDLPSFFTNKPAADTCSPDDATESTVLMLREMVEGNPTTCPAGTNTVAAAYDLGVANARSGIMGNNPVKEIIQKLSAKELVDLSMAVNHSLITADFDERIADTDKTTDDEFLEKPESKVAIIGLPPLDDGFLECNSIYSSFTEEELNAPEEMSPQHLSCLIIGLIRQFSIENYALLFANTAELYINLARAAKINFIVDNVFQLIHLERPVETASIFKTAEQFIQFAQIDSRVACTLIERVPEKIVPLFDSIDKVFQLNNDARDCLIDAAPEKMFRFKEEHEAAHSENSSFTP